MKDIDSLIRESCCIVLLIFAVISCKKDPPKTLPIITTSPVTNILQTTATSGGIISDDGNSPIVSRGVCWSTNENPTISVNKTTDGLGTGNFSSTIDNLSPGETYYVRAYATNSTGIGYGNIQTFSASERSVEFDYKPIGLAFEPLEILLSIPSDDSYIPQEFPNSKSLNLNYLLNVPSPATQAGNSCVGWAVGYGLMSFLFNSLEGYEDYDGYDKVFSPYYIWNQIRSDINKNDGIWISSALNLVVNQGCCKLSDMPINESYFTSLPTLTARNNASKYKLTSFMRCSFNLNKLKSYIAFDGIPIVIGLNVDKAFQNDGDSQFEKRNGKLVWTNYIDDSRDGHAVLICGFDDNINAFKVLNSWGKKWGENGYFWLDYEFAKKAINSLLGIHYSIFVAHVKRPKVYTNTVSNITSSSATCGGSITRTWDLNITEQGVVWSLNQNPSIADNKVTNNTNQNNFNCTISGLSKGTKYYIKAYAINSEGISYGKQVTFTTTSTRAPDVTTNEISSISSTYAVVGGNVTSDGGSNITERGVFFSTNTVSSGTKLQIGNGTGTFSTTLSGLTPGTTYYVKAYAINREGIAYGGSVNFTTLVGNVSLIAAFTASLTSINLGQPIQFSDQSTGNPTSWSWDFGDGSTSTTKNPTHTYSKAGTYNVSLTVSSSAGSNTITKINYITVTDINGILFNPNLTYGSVTDFDGNIYKTIQIGNQVWMAENLKVTKLNDGSPIMYDDDNLFWMISTTRSYCWYNNDIQNKNIYGALYNRHAINTGKLCPVGWHVSTDSNWSTLTSDTGGENYAAINLKETGNAHWSGSNSYATNSSGFTALPGGIRYNNGSFSSLNNNGVWWCTNPENYAFSSWFRTIFYNASDIRKYGLTLSPQLGLSVRCVKD